MSTFRGHSPSPRPAPPPPPPAGDASKSQGIDIQREVDEITEIMRINMQNIVEREVKLNELDRRADNLHESSRIFDKATGKIKKKYWWKNMKWMVIIGICGTVLVLIIAVSTYAALT